MKANYDKITPRINAKTYEKIDHHLHIGQNLLPIPEKLQESDGIDVPDLYSQAFFTKMGFIVGLDQNGQYVHIPYMPEYPIYYQNPNDNSPVSSSYSMVLPIEEHTYEDKLAFMGIKTDLFTTMTKDFITGKKSLKSIGGVPINRHIAKRIFNNLRQRCYHSERLAILEYLHETALEQNVPMRKKDKYSREQAPKGRYDNFRCVTFPYMQPIKIPGIDTNMDVNKEFIKYYNICIINQFITDGAYPGLVEHSVPIYEKILEYVEEHNSSSATKQWEKNNKIAAKMRQNVRRYITKIGRPVFEREPENKKKNTFDFIRIFIGLVHFGDKIKRNSMMREYKTELVKAALESIEKSKQFQRYGVPINCIQPQKITITNDDMVEIIFSLKNKLLLLKGEDE